MIFIILATGQSLSPEQVDYVRTHAADKNRFKIIAVSDAFKLAPDADILASHDVAWWKHNPASLDFVGLKMCNFHVGGVGTVRPDGVPVGCNSGLWAMFLARHLGAKKIILLGFDMWGSHFFGKHPAPLNNTTEARFKTHIRQFDGFAGPEVINCTPGSKLKKFPMLDLKEVLPC